MAYSSQEILAEIRDLLLGLEKELEYDNSGDNYDVNKYAEDFYCELINLVRSDLNLVNLNGEKKNHPAIDLGDSHSKVSVQVTSTSSKAKIQSTFDKFDKHNLSEKYNRIYILVLKGKKELMNVSGLNIPDGISFNKLVDIIDNQSIISWIRENKMKIEELQKIKNLIKSYVRKHPELFTPILLPTIRKIAERRKYKSQEIKLLTLYQIEEYLSIENDNKFITHLSEYANIVDIIIVNHSFKIEDNEFKDVYGDFIQKLSKIVNVNLSDIILVPTYLSIDYGNVTSWIESGLRQELSNDDKISQFIRQTNLKNDYSALDKILPYKNYEREFYNSVGGQSNVTNFVTSHTISKGDIKIGLCIPNPFILAPDLEKNRDHILGSYQIMQGLSEIAETDLKVLVLGISPDQLSEVDEEVFKSASKDFDIVILKSNINTQYSSSFFGRTYYQSPKYLDSYSFTTGFISINGFKETIENIESSYDLDNGNINEIIVELSLPTDGDLAYDVDSEAILSTVKNKFIEEIDKSLINYGTDSKAPSELNEIFVHPNLTNQPYNSNDEIKIRNFNLESIASDIDSYLLLGRKESGKTILLKRIMFEIHNSYDKIKKIPIFLKFKDLQEGTCTDVLISITGHSRSIIEDRAGSGQLIILIDDLTFDTDSITSLRCLNKFKVKHPKVKIIASAIHSHDNFLDPDNYTLIDECNLIPAYIGDFKSKEIKELTNKWFKYKPEIIEDEDQIDNIVKSFRTLGLPRTPMAISLYLWIIEKQERKPINNSSLLQNFIDNVLDKANLSQVYREKFDATNKLNLLADLSHHMLIKGNKNYSVEYGGLITYVDNYLISKGFNSKGHILFKPKKIVDNFIERGIFTEENNQVKFRFACFFSYFLAIRMTLSKEFKNYVLEGENYMNFLDEIEIYTGITRNDEGILRLMQDRMNESYSSITKKYDKNKIAEDIDLFFTQRDSIVDTVKIKSVIESKPTTQKIDETTDDNLDNLPVRTEIKEKKPLKQTPIFSFKLTKIVANILRNSEEVDNNKLKLDVYDDIIRNTALMACIEKAEMIRFFQENNKLPSFLPSNMSISALLRLIPIFGQISLFDTLGSLKMASTIFESINLNKNSENVSDLERFFSAFNYIDIKAIKWQPVIREFSNNSNISNSSRDLAFIKLVGYYYIRSKNNESEENFYLDQITALKTKGKKTTREMRHKLTSDLRRDKKKMID